jgi:hypothetical protein
VKEEGLARPVKLAGRMGLMVSMIGVVAVVVAACGAPLQPAGGSTETGARSATPASLATVAPSPTTAAAIVPSPYASVEPPVDTTSWLPFTSKLYGFTVAHPADWTVEPASGHWSLANSADANEDILTSPSGPPSPTGPPNLQVVELRIPSGMTADAFIQAYIEIAHVSDCYPSGSQLPQTTIDGHAASIAYGGCVQRYYFAEAIAFIGNRIWIFNLHGPDRSLIVPFLSTVKIDPTTVVD